MYRRTFLAIAALFALPIILSTPPSVAQTGDEPSAVEIAERVQAFYDKTKTFRAGFKQRYKVKQYGKIKKSKGEVIFKKPGKMSWRYSTNGNRVVSNGKKLKVYEKDNNQMYETAVDKSQYPAALAFLVGDGNLKKSFKLRKLDAKKLRYEGGYVLEGKPKEPTPAYQRIVLFVDGKTSHVQRVIVMDAQGNTNRFSFVGVRVNETVEKDEFDFRPPKGTKVVRP